MQKYTKPLIPYAIGPPEMSSIEMFENIDHGLSPASVADVPSTPPVEDTCSVTPRRKLPGVMLRMNSCGLVSRVSVSTANGGSRYQLEPIRNGTSAGPASAELPSAVGAITGA